MKGIGGDPHLPCSVEELQKQLEARSGLPPAQQILINEQGVNLRANQRLGSPRVEAVSVTVLLLR